MVPLFGAAYAVKLWCLYLVKHMLYQIKAPEFYTDLGLQKHTNGKIQGLFKAFEYFQVLFKANFIFNILFKTVLYI